MTGKFVISTFAMLLVVFMNDFAKIALATDRVRWSRKPETWNIGGFVVLSVVLGVAMLIEALLFLAVGWSRFGLAANPNALHSFSFLTMFYFGVFSILSARERRWFWATIPGKGLIAAQVAALLIATALTFVGLPGLASLPWWQVLTILGWAMFSCLVINDGVKVAMIEEFLPSAGS